ncbi:MAG: hypothetical protein AAFU03_17345 [Bacteroidota bacterium]
MNEKKKKIEQEVEKTLASIDALGRAEVNPFLLTRIMEELKEPPAKQKLSGQFTWGYVLVGLLLLVNIATIGKMLTNNPTGTRAAYIDELAREYALDFKEDRLGPIFY